MDPASYQIEAQVERDHWWFRGRRRILQTFLDGLDPPLPAQARVLDVGCGTGANTAVLGDRGRRVVGVDDSPIAHRLRRRAGWPGGVRAVVGTLPFADATFDLVAALDVLEHLDDDRAAIRELHRVARPGAAVLVFVPALRLLWGLQDEHAHHRRRYSRAGLRALVSSAGFEVERISYFNSFLFAPILAARVAMRIRRPPGIVSENQIGGVRLNALLERVFRSEAPLLARFDLPIGVSLACIARR